MNLFYYLRKRMTYTQMIAAGFLLIILAGSVLLCLPVSSRTGEWTSFADSAFTATSATCVTGLIVFDTCTHWSLFGQIVILLLIQTGGIGFMTFITMFSVFLKRRISLHERKLLMQSAGTMRISGVVKLLKRIVAGTFLFEGIGAALLAVRFCPEMGLAKGLYYAVFHSVSAFCNAGFDIMGFKGQFSSFTGYVNDPLVSLTLGCLICVGGIGFIVWDDILRNRLRFSKYSFHSKIVLFMSAVLILIGWAGMFVFEKNASMADMSVGERLLASLFQAVTPRTAGFNTIDYSKASESGILLTVMLMLIGGSPGSTAGGIKTTTILVLLMGVISSAKHRERVSIFKRSLEPGSVRQASAVFSVYFFAVAAATVLLCAIEPLTIKQAMFETVSAVGTVGLSMSVTPSLSLASRIVLMVLMFAGRVGGLTLMLVLAEKRTVVSIDRPSEKILIG